VNVSPLLTSISRVNSSISHRLYFACSVNFFPLHGIVGALRRHNFLVAIIVVYEGRFLMQVLGYENSRYMQLKHVNVITLSFNLESKINPPV
jgi:hypothetical protein